MMYDIYIHIYIYMCTHTHVYRQTDRRTDSHTDTQALFSFPCDGHHAILPCTTSTTWPCTNIGHVLTSTATAKAPGQGGVGTPCCPREQAPLPLNNNSDDTDHYFISLHPNYNAWEGW